jgi:PAS domain S-box-containing protein
MVMKSRKQTVKTLEKDLIYKFFMEEPLPMAITNAKDGTYVAANKATLRLMGLSHKKLIGHKSTELGFISTEGRQSFLADIKKQGFAKNIPVKLNIKDRVVLHMLLKTFPVKIGKETFLMFTATDISNQKSITEKFRNDIFYKVTKQDDKFVKEKLKHFSLTSRQQEIALLSAIGHSNNEIAKKLFISPYTVKDHQKEIFRIIGIHSRNELFPKLLNLL